MAQLARVLALGARGREFESHRPDIVSALQQHTKSTYNIPMLALVLAILIVLWFLGIVQINSFTIPHIKLFALNGHTITLVNVLIFFAILWLTELLPSPFRQVAFALLILYALSLFGFIVIAGFSNLVIVAVIVGVILALFQKK